MFLKNKIENLFVIPAIFIKFLNSNTISVKIMVNELKQLNINLGETINISIECCRIIDDYGYSLYLKKNGENINLEKLSKLANFDGLTLWPSQGRRSLYLHIYI